MNVVFIISCIFIFFFSLLIFKSLEMKVFSLMTLILLISISFPEMMLESTMFQLDFLSTSMCNLSLLLTSISLVVLLNQESKEKKKMCMISGLVAFVFFSSNNLMMFFILFECSLIPLIIIILGWGKQPERITAGAYIMIYTLLSSFPLFCSVVFLEEEMVIFSMNNPLINSDYCLKLWSEGMNMAMGISLIISFLMKVPLLFLHSWLPKAHVEAPLEGSIILAGIMLKVGSFGIIRMLLILSSDSIKIIQDMIICISVLGSVLSAIMALSSDDLKLSIALSSISHMNFLISSIMPMSEMTLFSTNCTMVSHGFSSSILFFFVTLIYEMNNSRSISIVKGSASKTPQILMFGLIFFSLSIAIPPSISFMGELTSISIIWNHSSYLLVVIILFIVFNSLFSMTTFGMLSHSSKKKNFIHSNELNSFNLSSICLCMIMCFVFFFPSVMF